MRIIKYIKSIILLTTILCSFGIQAQHVGRIDKFEISPAYLEDGRIKISEGATTTVKYKVTFVRELDSATHPLKWKPFNIKVRLGTGNSNGNIILFETPVKVTGAQFASDQAFLRDQEYTATIDNSKLSTGNPIILSYTINDTDQPIYSYNNKVYYAIGSNQPPGIDSDLYPVYIIRSSYYGGTRYSASPDVQPGSGEKNRGIAFYLKSGVTSTHLFYRQLKINYGSGFPHHDYKYEGSQGSGWEYTGLGLWVKNTPSTGTVPVYKYSNSEGKNIFYSTFDYSSSSSSDISQGISFYAYPVPGGGRDPDRDRDSVTRPESGNGGRINIAPEDWISSGDGTFYYLRIEDTTFSNSFLDNFDPMTQDVKVHVRFSRTISMDFPFEKDGIFHDISEYDGGITLIIKNIDPTVAPQRPTISYVGSFTFYDK